MHIAQKFEAGLEKIQSWVSQRTVAEIAALTLSYASLEAGVAAIEAHHADAQPVTIEATYSPEPFVIVLPASITTTTIAPTTTTTITPETTSTTQPDTLLHAAEATTYELGNDVSWPNCDLALLPGISFGILGVNDGQEFEKNRCLRQLWDRFLEAGITPSLYVNTGLDLDRAIQNNDPAIPCPYVGTVNEAPLCPPYRDGFKQGEFNLAAAAELPNPQLVWYLDVEGRLAWSDNIDFNRVALQGLIDATRLGASRAAGVSPNAIYFAIYSYRNAYKAILGDWQPGFHTWFATGGPLEKAAQKCQDQAANLTGGGVVMVQFVGDNGHGQEIDIDIRC